MHDMGTIFTIIMVFEHMCPIIILQFLKSQKYSLMFCFTSPLNYPFAPAKIISLCNIACAYTYMYNVYIHIYL